MRKFYREVIALAESCGVADAEIDRQKRGHPRLCGTVNGEAISMPFSSTPSDNRTIVNLRADLRRRVRGEVPR